MSIYSKLFHSSRSVSLITKEIRSVSSSISSNKQKHHLRLGRFPMEAPLLSDSESKLTSPEARGSTTKMKYAMGLALLSTTVTAVNAGEPSSDAEKWIKIGIQNANRDLDQFDSIASALSSGSTDHTALDVQLKLLQNVLTDVGDNNRQLIPQILSVITKINGFLEADPPSVFCKMGLKALIWYVDGKRDNKSYYLLDGAQLWSELRIKVLQKYKGTPAVDQLIVDLQAMQKETIYIRDELDGFAQIFVKGIKDIHSMTGDIGKNLEALRAIAKELLVVSEQAEGFLEHTKEMEKQVAYLVKMYE